MSNLHLRLRNFLSSGTTAYDAIGNGWNGFTSGDSIDGTAALHHVAVTLNSSTGTLYVDGQQVGISNGMTVKPSDLGVTTQNWIGHSQFSADPYLDGKVDDFRIYNQALTVSQVTEVMEGN